MKSCTFIDYVLKGHQPVTQWSMVCGLKHSTLVQGLLPINFIMSCKTQKNLTWNMRIKHRYARHGRWQKHCVMKAKQLRDAQPMQGCGILTFSPISPKWRILNKIKKTGKAVFSLSFSRQCDFDWCGIKMEVEFCPATRLKLVGSYLIFYLIYSKLSVAQQPSLNVGHFRSF